MSVQANTRIWKGSILAVSAGLGDTASTGEMMTLSGLSAAAIQIAVSTAASIIDEFVLGLPDSGTVDMDFLLDMDDDFEVQMELMRDNQETRTFTLTMAEGTLNTFTFDAYVIDGAVTAAANDVYKMKLSLGVSGAVVITAV